MRSLSLLLALTLTLPLAAAQQYVWMPGQGQPDPEVGPDAPRSPFPKATVVAFEDEEYRFTAGTRYREIDVPSGWSRVVLEYRQRPDGDPWDRLFQVFFGDAEVLRGTTPRTDFTVEKDVTRYASLLPQGGKARVGIDTSAWDQPAFAQFVTVKLHFYDDATSALVEPAADVVVPVTRSVGMCQGSVATRAVEFPATPQSDVTLEFFASNHGDEEAQFFSRRFDVVVDGEVLTQVYVFPYRYAWIGAYGGNDDLHVAMWWSAFRALDVLGVHTGPGEIPPYRLQLDAEQSAKLVGAKTVEVRAQSVYGCVWITSLSFLMSE